LREFAPDGRTLADATGIDPDLAARVYPRIVEKLEREPIEDYRIDFEDGFGNRPDEEEDRVARQSADEIAAGRAAGSLPPRIGIRIKPPSGELKARSLRTFELFLTELCDRTHDSLPTDFVITLPKITTPDEIDTVAAACDAFERRRRLPPGILALELMVETTQSIMSSDGRFALPSLVAAGRGRVVAAHFGPYDYSAACDIAAGHQHLRHAACDLARGLMQISLAGTGIWLSDGPTTVLPVGPRRARDAETLAAADAAENRRIVHHAWRIHAGNVRHALVHGFYQGWDLHPAQLPTRYAAVYAFFLEGLEAASKRLRNFVDQAARATLVGNVFDDAATGQGLLNYFLRAINCGALTEDEAIERSGLTLDELRSRSFPAILANRHRSR
jgi:citrate lyase beta subunit